MKILNLTVRASLMATLVLALVPGAWAAECSAGKTASKTSSSKTVVETAVEAGSFETLVAAVQAAGLVETLNGEGPFTVFAPTDAAFEKLPEGMVAALLADKNKLTQVLTYHVVPGEKLAGDVLAASSLDTVFGQPLAVTSVGSPTVGGAGIVQTDIACSNGVIHVIDSVMLPKNIVEIAAGNDSFSTLVAAVKAAGLAETLSGDGPFTVFAPTDAAFAAIPEETLKALLLPENKEQLTNILTYHVVPGKLTAADVAGMTTMTTVQGAKLTIALDKAENGDLQGVMLDDARIVGTDVVASNGLIHVIDGVVMPSGK